MTPEATAAQQNKLKVAIIGGGLVGALSACFFAKRGHEVHLYEYRSDIRDMQHVSGRSINLSLSTRGRAALREVGLEETVVQNFCIPMYARMIHNVKGDKNPIAYGHKDQCILSVGRRQLNELLLSAAEKYPNVHIHFLHKLVTADLSQGLITFQKQDTKEVVIESADMVVGADGAYSMARRQLMKQPMFNYSQTYIEHGYLELAIPSDGKGEHTMEKNYLHIWPREQFMMIALPNQDGSWTVSLFMPFAVFDSLKTQEQLISFFKTNYPDAIPLIGENRLVKDFFSSKPSPLVSVKCNPYNVGNRVIIIGDAAHAMVPFYGQGMNAGFEDCRLLDEMLQKYSSDVTTALREFSTHRNPDVEAMCDLAMYNYVELRDLVNRRSFLWRKKFDMFVHRLMPSFWIPLYTSVTFTHMRYSDCIKNKHWQDKVLKRSLQVFSACSVVGITFACVKWYDNIEQVCTTAFNKLKVAYVM